MGTNLLFAAMIACTGENMVQHLSGFPRLLVMLDGGVLTACALGAGPAIATHPASEVYDVYLDGISGRYPGDPDGAGRATLWFDESNERVCARLEVWEVEEPIEVSLHISPEGHVGPLVVPLRGRTTGMATHAARSRAPKSRRFSDIQLISISRSVTMTFRAER